MNTNAVRTAMCAAAVLLASAPVATGAAPQRPDLPGPRETYLGSPSARVEGPAADGVRMAPLEGLVFRHGSIEFDIAGEVQPGAHPDVRGFVGLAFAVTGPDAYECVYLRVTNGRAESQERRNHTVQYVSQPHYSWRRLRTEKVSQYESYADVGPGEWIRLRIEIDARRARVFVNGAPRPALAVDRLPNPGGEQGGLALWAAQGSTAHFRNLTVTPAD